MLKKKSFKDITITEIVETAGLTRPTFYQHYASKESLLLECFIEVSDKTARKVARLSRKDQWYLWHEEFNIAVFKQHLKNRKIIQSIFEANLESLMISELYDRWYVMFKDRIEVENVQIEPDVLKMFVIFYLGGLVHLMKLMFNQEDIPTAEQLGKLNSKLVFNYAKHIVFEIGPEIDFKKDGD